MQVAETLRRQVETWANQSEIPGFFPSISARTLIRVQNKGKEIKERSRSGGWQFQQQGLPCYSPL